MRSTVGVFERNSCEEDLLERVDENKHGWTILKLMRLLKDREKKNT